MNALVQQQQQQETEPGEQLHICTPSQWDSTWEIYHGKGGTEGRGYRGEGVQKGGRFKRGGVVQICSLIHWANDRKMCKRVNSEQVCTVHIVQVNVIWLSPIQYCMVIVISEHLHMYIQSCTVPVYTSTSIHTELYVYPSTSVHIELYIQAPQFEYIQSGTVLVYPSSSIHLELYIRAPTYILYRAVQYLYIRAPQYIQSCISEHLNIYRAVYPSTSIHTELYSTGKSGHLNT